MLRRLNSLLLLAAKHDLDLSGSEDPLAVQIRNLFTRHYFKLGWARLRLLAKGYPLHQAEDLLSLANRTPPPIPPGLSFVFWDVTRALASSSPEFRRFAAESLGLDPITLADMSGDAQELIVWTLLRRIRSCGALP